MAWRCYACGFLHISGRSRRPRRCPSCSSTRLRSLGPLEISQELKSSSPLSVEQLLLLLRILRLLPWEEREWWREEMKKSYAIHVLKVSEDHGGLVEILGREEARAYLRLIEEMGFGLASWEGVDMVVGPDSPIRKALGVSSWKLKELRKAAGEEG